MSAEALSTSVAVEFIAGEVRNLFTESEFILRIDGQDLPLGRVRNTCATARVETLPAVPDGTAADTEVDVTFVPGSDCSISISLVPLQHASS
jgi:hypothetical protein